MLNPGGSIKDRPATKMLLDAYHRGEMDLDTTVVESSSGNLGVGLAQACAYLGLKLICVTDTKSSTTVRKIIKAYGGRIDMVTEPDPEDGFLGARLKRVRQLLDTLPNSFSCDQYKNLNNPRAHHQTIEEVLQAIDGKVDYLFCATSTCGTLRGCSEYVRAKGLDVKIIGVDAKGSVIFGDSPRERLIPGHGASVVPPHYCPGLEDDFVLVSDLDCVGGCRQLIRREGIFSGGSSGAVMAGIGRMRNKIPAGATVVGILCDRGERYLDTIYSDDWVREHFDGQAYPWETAFAAGENEWEQSF